MFFVARRSTRALVVGVLVIASQALFVSGPTRTESRSCDRLRQWAQAYTQTTPSPTLEDFGRLDRAHRVALFATVAPNVRAELWRTHLGRFAQEPTLSSAQRTLIAEAITLTTPALYQKTPADAGYKMFWARAEPAFKDSPEHMWAWFDLGPRPQKRLQTVSAWDRLTRPFTATAQYPDCECTMEYQFVECAWANGLCGGGGCYVWTRACGPQMQWDCYGMCVL